VKNLARISFYFLVLFVLGHVMVSFMDNEPRQSTSAVAENIGKHGGEQGETMPDKIVKTDEEWKEQLTPEQYQIARMKETERAFTGEYYRNKDSGVYL